MSSTVLPRERRAAIENVIPQIEGGRFAVKRTVGEELVVEADVFVEGHDPILAVLKVRPAGEARWMATPMTPLGNDRWRGTVRFDAVGLYDYTIEARPGQDPGLSRGTVDSSTPVGTCASAFQVVVDPVRARYGAWYQIFPRSCAGEPGRHGTFGDLEHQLPRIAAMGFDVIYVPPIHPLGTTNRKGRNNAVRAAPGDPGSPWAVGSAAGGHKAVHPELGTLADFRHLLGRARALGMEIALDLAFQCTPDHPYVAEHPDWFRRRADGSFDCAADPPHEYQDVLALDFQCSDWRSLWAELESIVDFWVEQGVRVFRMDNPHTKPFLFWEQLLRNQSRRHPDLVFLSEGLTRPKVMRHLAKVGFNQSYDYFPWRVSRAELVREYSEITQGELAEYFRPVLWVNTAQLLPRILQDGGRGAFVLRAVLAATLGASYGVYGPAFEVCFDQSPGSEEYQDSEQYELRCWDLESPGNLQAVLARLNEIRRANPALHQNRSLVFHDVENDQLLAYSKRSEDGQNTILVVVNLDSRWRQGGWVRLALEPLGLACGQPFRVHDLLDGASYAWVGERNYVELSPERGQHAHVFRVEV